MDRIKDWEKFSKQMVKHINVYAKPQYQSEDKAIDEAGLYSSQECVLAINKYINRYGKGVRGNIEALRDMFKISHYGQIAYEKLSRELGATIYEEPKES